MRKKVAWKIVNFFLYLTTGFEFKNYHQSVQIKII